jgi:enoyl-CoA hydratase
VPHKIAMEFMLTGKHYNAQRAYEVGFVNQVTPNGKHMEVAMDYAKILRDSAPLVITMLKRFIRNTVLPQGPSEQSGIARRDLLAVSNSQDQEEGGRAFKEKRRPAFIGK